MKKIIFIFARGGSKGIPNKNIKIFNGKPLLTWSIELAKSIPMIEKIFVSTDDEDIAQVATKCGVELITRPKDLAEDDSPEWLAWQHAIEIVQKNYGFFDIFISLPATSPLRSKEDVIKCINLLDKNTDFIVTMSESKRSPWFNMVNKKQNGYLSLISQSNYVRRQDTPTSYDLTTVAYVARPSFILENQNIWDGNVKGVIIPEQRAIDIDSVYDFKIAELISNNKSFI